MIAKLSAERRHQVESKTLSRGDHMDIKSRTNFTCLTSNEEPQQCCLSQHKTAYANSEIELTERTAKKSVHQNTELLSHKGTTDNSCHLLVDEPAPSCLSVEVEESLATLCTIVSGPTEQCEEYKSTKEFVVAPIGVECKQQEVKHSQSFASERCTVNVDSTDAERNKFLPSGDDHDCLHLCGEDLGTCTKDSHCVPHEVDLDVGHLNSIRSDYSVAGKEMASPATVSYDTEAKCDKVTT